MRNTLLNAFNNQAFTTHVCLNTDFYVISFYSLKCNMILKKYYLYGVVWEQTTSKRTTKLCPCQRICKFKVCRQKAEKSLLLSSIYTACPVMRRLTYMLADENRFHSYAYGFYRILLNKKGKKACIFCIKY